MAGNIDDMSAKRGVRCTKLLYCSSSIDISEMEHFVAVGTLGGDVIFLFCVYMSFSFRLILFINYQLYVN